MTATEEVVLVDAANNEIGTCDKLIAHQQNRLHRAFSIFIFRDQPERELLLQQRALIKYHSPGLWTNTCCSHPRSGEAITLAGQRRLQEEFGFTTTLRDLGWFHYNAYFQNGLSENEIDHVLIGCVPANIALIPNPNEINAYQWITIAALVVALDKTPERFTPWLKQALVIVQK